MRMAALTVEAVMALGRKCMSISLCKQFMFWDMGRQRGKMKTASQQGFRDGKGRNRR